jgi:hypothetical protein
MGFVGNAARMKNVDAGVAAALREEIRSVRDELAAQIAKLKEELTSASADKGKSDKTQNGSIWKAFFSGPRTRYGLPIDEWRKISANGKCFLEQQERASTLTWALIFGGLALGVAAIFLTGRVINEANVNEQKVFRFFLYVVLIVQFLVGQFSVMAAFRPGVNSFGLLDRKAQLELERRTDFDFVRASIAEPAFIFFGLAVTRRAWITGVLLYWGIPIFIFLFVANWPDWLQLLFPHGSRN